MTGRERIRAICNREQPDRLSWTTIVDEATLSNLPANLQGLSGIEFYKYIGCDIFLLNCWGMPYDFRSPVIVWPQFVEEVISCENERFRRELRTPEGSLTSTRVNGHPVEFPVKTVKDANLYRRIWAETTLKKSDDLPVYERVTSEIGDYGVVTRFWGPSTIPMLLEEDMGMIHFYDMYAQHPDELAALITTIHDKHLEAFEILAQGPCDIVILIENTDINYIHPEIYRKYNGMHVKDFVDIIHKAGKTAIIHMCGHVRGLLDQIRMTGLDGVHALTPSPTGDTSAELALDELGDDLIIIGTLDPTIFCLGPIEGIGQALDRLYTPRLRRSNFILCAGADGIVVPLERFNALADWMARNG